MAVIDAIAGEGRSVGCGEKERKFSRQNFVLRGGSGSAEIGMLAVGFLDDCGCSRRWGDLRCQPWILRDQEDL